MRLLFIPLLLLATAAHAAPCPADSSYTSETERSISRTFAPASQRDIVLSFDEADALFGDRTQTRDADDRYANQEVSYLLTRIEELGNIELLTSNRRQMVVAGFDRRARYAGMILVRTDTGARVLEFSRANRARAIAFARESPRACP